MVINPDKGQKYYFCRLCDTTTYLSTRASRKNRVLSGNLDYFEKNYLCMVPYKRKPRTQAPIERQAGTVVASGISLFYDGRLDAENGCWVVALDSIDENGRCYADKEFARYPKDKYEDALLEAEGLSLAMGCGSKSYQRRGSCLVHGQKWCSQECQGRLWTKLRFIPGGRRRVVLEKSELELAYEKDNYVSEERYTQFDFDEDRMLGLI
jgi:hypothetical protein